ncbi:MAG: hypothetical protein LBP69_02225 [Treponema sp.]|nr:hypothetical protein [Treponema sp.]
MGKAFSAAFVCVFLFFSCIGTGSGISIRADGTGTIQLEYRLAKELEGLGKLDGNERWLPVPVGKADLERTVNRVEGLRLVSFSSKEDGKDIVYSARLDFDSPRALTGFLDASGRQVELDMEKKRLAFTFAGAENFVENSAGFSAENSKAGFRDMVVSSFSGYEFSLVLNMPAAVSLRWLDENGAETRNPGTCSLDGAALDFSSPMSDLVLLEKACVMEITW